MIKVWCIKYIFLSFECRILVFTLCIFTSDKDVNISTVLKTKNSTKRNRFILLTYWSIDPIDRWTFSCGWSVWPSTERSVWGGPVWKCLPARSESPLQKEHFLFISFSVCVDGRVSGIFCGSLWANHVLNAVMSEHTDMREKRSRSFKILINCSCNHIRSIHISLF